MLYAKHASKRLNVPLTNKIFQHYVVNRFGRRGLFTGRGKEIFFFEMFYYNYTLRDPAYKARATRVAYLDTVLLRRRLRFGYIDGFRGRYPYTTLQKFLGKSPSWLSHLKAWFFPVFEKRHPTFRTTRSRVITYSPSSKVALSFDKKSLHLSFVILLLFIEQVCLKKFVRSLLSTEESKLRAIKKRKFFLRFLGKRRKRVLHRFKARISYDFGIPLTRFKTDSAVPFALTNNLHMVGYLYGLLNPVLLFLSIRDVFLRKKAGLLGIPRLIAF